MGWKDWSYAKKGFVIGLIYGIIALLITYVVSFQGSRPTSPIFIPFSIFTWPLAACVSILAVFLSLIFPIQYATDIPGIWFFGAILLVLITTGIGWIIDKIKAK